MRTSNKFFTKNVRRVLCGISCSLLLSDVIFNNIFGAFFDAMLALYWANTLTQKEENDS